MKTKEIRGRRIDNRLLRAANDGDVAEIEAALADGANVNAVFVSSSGNSASTLGVALREDHTAVIRCLLELGADANLSTNVATGSRPLHNAAMAGNVETTKMLFAAGADPTRRDVEKETPRDFARNDRHDAVAELLREAEENWGSTTET